MARKFQCWSNVKKPKDSMRCKNKAKKGSNYCKIHSAKKKR